jgi:NAD+ kinase
MLGSKPRSAEAVRRAAVVTHDAPEALGDALARLEACARAAGVELLPADGEGPDLVIALGGDGTMLRALRGALGTGTPVLGINFGRVGFLTTVEGERLEAGLARVFAGEFKVVELATLAASVGAEAHHGVNDVVVTSSRPGRMVDLGWQIGGEDLGTQSCDGVICCTPSGSTAYNLSNGGPVMMWGLDALAITFVAPHSLFARPLVVPRGLEVRITNRTLGGRAVTVLVDGQAVGEMGESESFSIGVGKKTSHLALLPEVTFFTRYYDVFLYA